MPNTEVHDNTLIPATTDAVVSEPFIIPGQGRGVVQSVGLGEDEAVEVLRWAAGDYRACGVVLTEEAPALQIIGKGRYVVSKPVTASPVSVSLDY